MCVGGGGGGGRGESSNFQMHGLLLIHNTIQWLSLTKKKHKAMVIKLPVSQTCPHPLLALQLTFLFFRSKLKPIT